MQSQKPLIPRQPTPELDLPLVGGGHFDLAGESSERFTMIVFYRGYHCPACRVQLKDIESKLDDLAKRGVSVVGISSDTKERAESTKTEWALPHLRIGHSLSPEDARRWGLYLSAGRGLTSIGIEEPALFSEPGLFLIRPNRELYFANVQSMPFARPHMQDVLSALDFVIAKDYPGRGEIVPDVA